MAIDAIHALLSSFSLDKHTFAFPVTVELSSGGSIL